jgi:hypothetical protein
MSATIPEADVERARNVSILEVWERLGLPSVREGRANCSPFREDRDPSLQVGGGANIVFDHATGERLDGVDLVRKVKNCGFAEAVDFVLGDNRIREGEPQGTPAQRQVNHERRAKPWPDLGTAEREFVKLPLAREDAGALGMFERDYGLRAEWVPETWRVFSQNGSRALVHEGRDPEGRIVAYKAKTIARDPKGKRRCWFLYGGGGAIWLWHKEGDAALVVVSGEEKAAAACAAGFHALSPLTGEKPLDEVWIRNLAEVHRATILANDADEAGERANLKTAEALEKVGFPSEKISVIDWPTDAPPGWDLNDALKRGGLDAVRDLLKAARPWQSRLPRVLPAIDFLAAEREPLKFHIEGLLPYQGKLTFSAPTKWGKSMWAIQVGFALAGGDCEWLGWRFGAPARVLYFQAEIADPLLEDRLGAILREMPPEIDRDRAQRNFFIQEIAENRPNLYHEQGRRIAEGLIVRWRPQVIILDPLSGICPGMEENAAESMSLVLDYFSNLTVRFGCAVILVHHHGKAGFSRGSSVFEAWPESDLQASFVQCGDEIDREVTKVEMRLRCQYNSGPVYWQMPSEANLWFQAMPDGWLPESGRKKKATQKHAGIALRAAGTPQSWTNLVAAIRDMTGCGQRTAENIVKEAREEGLVRLMNGCYVLPE